MRGHQDAASFIKSFTGSHHFVLDYLVEEVLGQQSESVQAFLLRTAILDYLCGPLCDAVVLDPSVSGQETLEYIEHANLFIVPLDKERRWYRYQHQFAELLRQRLHQSAASVAELHIRASIWYEDNGLGGVGFQVHPRLLTSLTPLRRFYERTRISSKLDVAFLLESPARLASLQSEALAEEPLMVLAPPDHRLVGSCRVEPADMAGEQILLTEPWGNYRLMFERELAEAGAVPSAALELDGVEAVKQCVVAGMGVAMLPAVTVEAELERGELATLRWAGRSLTIPAQTFSL
jgi:hypothetical protein